MDKLALVVGLIVLVPVQNSRAVGLERLGQEFKAFVCN